MLVLDDLREDYNITNREPLESDTNLQEERRKTGRCLAAGIVIFLVVLGLYHAIPDGSTRLSALLGAAFIMFSYLLWLLYSSERKKRLLKARELAMKKEILAIFNKPHQTAEEAPNPRTPNIEGGQQMLGRSYSIA